MLFTCKTRTHAGESVCVRAAPTQGQLKDADRIFVVVATARISSRF